MKLPYSYERDAGATNEAFDLFLISAWILKARDLEEINGICTNDVRSPLTKKPFEIK
jgi:hypothetical protein